MIFLWFCLIFVEIFHDFGRFFATRIRFRPAVMKRFRNTAKKFLFNGNWYFSYDVNSWCWCRVLSKSWLKEKEKFPKVHSSRWQFFFCFFVFQYKGKRINKLYIFVELFLKREGRTSYFTLILSGSEFLIRIRTKKHTWKKRRKKKEWLSQSGFFIDVLTLCQKSLDATREKINIPVTWAMSFFFF